MKHVRPLGCQVKYAADDTSSAAVWIEFIIDLLTALQPVIEDLVGKNSSS